MRGRSAIFFSFFFFFFFFFFNVAVVEKTIESVDAKVCAIATGSAQKIRTVSKALDSNNVFDYVDELLDSTLPEEPATPTPEEKKEEEEEVPAQPLHDASLMQRSQGTLKKAAALGGRVTHSSVTVLDNHKQLVQKYVETKKTQLLSQFEMQRLKDLTKSTFDKYVTKEYLALAASLALLSHEKLLQLTIRSYPNATQKMTALLPEKITTTASSLDSQMIEVLKSYSAVEEEKKEEQEQGEELKNVLDQTVEEEEEAVEEVEEEADDEDDEIFVPSQVNETLDSLDSE
jgi:hypothetical protein